MPVFHRRMFNVVVTSTPAERRLWLAEAADPATAAGIVLVLAFAIVAVRLIRRRVES